MANLKVGNTNVGKISIIEPYEDVVVDNKEEAASDWTRPSHWIDMPVINSGEHKCAFLYAIPSGENNPQRFVSLYARGNYNGNYRTDYTIDWGDESTTSYNHYNSYAQTQTKEYDFESLPLESEFEIDGVIHRQALVVLSANSGIRDINWRYYRNFTGGTREYPSNNILEFNINTPSGEYFGGNPSNSTRHRLPYLEKARVYAPQAISFNSLFQNTPALRSIDLHSGVMPNLTQVKYLFAGCGIDYLPDLDTSNVSFFNGMFQSISNIKELPSGKYDFSNVHPTGLSSFASYSRLEKIHIDISSNVTNLSSLFYLCKNLKRVTGNWDTSNVTNFGNFAGYCYSLRTTPEINFVSATTMSKAFLNCAKIKNEFFIKASGCTNFDQAFSNCRSIEKVTIADMSNYKGNTSARFNSVFSSCVSLKKVEVINPRIGPTAYSQGAGSFFNSCLSLEYVPYLDLSGVKNLSSMFYNCWNLKKIAGLNTPDANNFYRMFYYCKDFYEVPDLDITCRGTGNVSIRQIFEHTNISEVPNYDFSRCYSMEGWKNSTKIQSGVIPLDLSNMISSVSTYQYNGNLGLHPISEISNLTIGSGANLRSSFANMRDLKSIPFVDASNGYSYIGLFNGCSNLEAGALSGTNVSIGYYKTALGSGAVMDVFNNLASGVTGQTIDMRYTAGVYMLSDQERAIPVSKGWTLLT